MQNLNYLHPIHTISSLQHVNQNRILQGRGREKRGVTRGSNDSVRGEWNMGEWEYWHRNNRNREFFFI